MGELQAEIIDEKIQPELEFWLSLVSELSPTPKERRCIFDGQTFCFGRLQCAAFLCRYTIFCLIMSFFFSICSRSCNGSFSKLGFSVDFFVAFYPSSRILFLRRCETWPRGFYPGY